MNNGSNEKIVSVNIAGHEYKIKVKENIRDRPYISLTLHLNLNKKSDLELARYLEQLSREYNVRSNNELLRRILQEHKELREKVRELESKLEELREWFNENTEIFYFELDPHPIIVKGPEIVLMTLRAVRNIVDKSTFKKIIETLSKIQLIKTQTKLIRLPQFS